MLTDGVAAGACRWFEVDQKEVVVAKKVLLTEYHAALQARDKTSATFPLKAAEWSIVSADLQVSGWTTALIDQGFDPSQPCLWHAEGLLNYLTPDAVKTLLIEASQVSPSSDLKLTC